MKVAVDLNTKKIIDLLPDEATSESSYLTSNNYNLLEIENPVLNHIENEDGTITVIFRDLTENDFISYNQQNYKSIRQNLVDNIEITYNEVVYQGDEISQDRMSRYINGINDIDIVLWIAKDNSKVSLTKEDLKQILRLAGIEQTKVW